MIKRLFATLVAPAAVAAALVTPAAASPEDGQGCAGVKGTLAYVCVISTDVRALPGATTTPLPVTVPPICYVAGCTPPTTVNVPIPEVREGEGNLIVLWHNGVYYPFAVESDGPVKTLMATIDTAVGLAQYYVGFVLALYRDAGATIGGVRDDVEARVYGVRDDVEAQVYGVRDDVQAQVDSVREDVQAEVDSAVGEVQDRYVDTVLELYEDREYYACGLWAGARRLVGAGPQGCSP